MNFTTNLLGVELRTNSGAVGTVVMVMVTASKVEVMLVESSGIFITTALQNCRLLK